MYVTVTLELDCSDGTIQEFEFGADAEPFAGGNGWAAGWGVDEPDVSAPGCSVALSRIADHDYLVGPWADAVEEALLEAALESQWGHGDDTDRDEYTDREDY